MNTQEVNTFLELARSFKSSDWSKVVTRAYGRLSAKDKNLIDIEAHAISKHCGNLGLIGGRELLAKIGMLLLR